MSRAQSGQAFDTATSQNTGYNTNAEDSYKAAQGDIGSYKDQLAKFSADNPYVEGGQYQTAENQQLADTAAAGSQAAGQALQSAAVRGGMNPAAGIAATEAIASQNDRNMADQESKATQDRLGAGAQYGQTVLGATAVPEQMDASLASTEAGAAGNALSTATDAAKTPSFMDQLGTGLIQAGTSFAGGFGAGLGKKCWIAAKLFGGWGDPRTVSVRLWMGSEFTKKWYGRAFVWAYERWGEAVANQLDESPWLKRQMQRLFDEFLRHAEQWQFTSEGQAVHEQYKELRRLFEQPEQPGPVWDESIDWPKWSASRAVAIQKEAL